MLRGVVLERGTRKAVPTALLVRYKTDEVLAEVDAEGRFELTVPRRQLVLHVKAPGYEPYTAVEHLQRGDTLNAVYLLTSADPAGQFVTTVRDDARGEEEPRHSLHGGEMRDVAGTMGDPFRAVMLLPGVSGVMSGIAYPVVRGTQPASTATYVDGVRIPALYHLLVGHAVVYPELLDELHFYPGSPPPEFGRVLGAVVDTRTRPLKKEAFGGFASLDLVNAGGLLEAAVTPTTRVGVSGRFSYTPFLISFVQDVTNASNRPIADFFDYQGRLRRLETLFGRARRSYLW